MKNKYNFFKKTSWIWITIGLLLGFSCVVIFRNYFDGVNKTPQICKWETCFAVELASIPEEQQQGLMYREYLEEMAWMLFVFSKESVHNFWMKNTIIPLDIIWIDNQYKVVRRVTAQPCEAEPCMIYKPEVLAKYVLELNAWIAEKYGIIEWDILQFKNMR